MKRYLYITIVALTGLMAGCESHTYNDLAEPEPVTGPVTYDGNVKAIIDANCISCHSPGGASSFRPLTNYEEVRDAVLTTNLLQRIQLQNGEEGQMPQTGRMPQNKIDIILQWNADGLPQN